MANFDPSKIFGNFPLQTTVRIRSLPSALNQSVRRIEQEFEEANESIQQLRDNQPKHYERLLNNVFNGIKKKVEEAEEETIKAVRKVPIEQQREIVVFWNQFGPIVKDAMDLINTMYYQVLSMIWDGVHNIGRSVKECFLKIFETIRSIL